MDAALRKQYARLSVKPEKPEHRSRRTVRLTFLLDSLKPWGLRGAAASSLIKNLRYLPGHTATKILIYWVFLYLVYLLRFRHKHIISKARPSCLLRLFEACD